MALAIDRVAAALPRQTAIQAGSRTLTYAELHGRASRLASVLRSHLDERTPVGLYLNRSIAYVIGALASLRAGSPYVLIAPDLPPDRVGFVLADAGVQVLLTSAALAAPLPRIAARLITLDDEAEEAAGEVREAAYPVGADDLAYVVYTSGSSGRPKGVGSTYRGLLNLIDWHQWSFGVTSADWATFLANPGFDASVWELWPHLTAGAAIYIPDDATRLAPTALRDWLVENQITVAFLPTPLAEQVMQLTWPPTTALRYLLTGGDVLHRYPLANLPFTLVNNYGISECSVVSTTIAFVGEQASGTLPPIGRPIANTDLYILDDNFQLCEPGVAAELWIGGPSLARGYIGNPALTAAKFVPSPYATTPGQRLYRTGDIALIDTEGAVDFLGRLDRQVKVRGYRIELDEIAAVLLTCPSIAASVVVMEEADTGGEEVVAYIVPRPDGTPSTAAVRDFLRTQLPEYMIPTTFTWIGSIPTTPNGKIGYRRLGDQPAYQARLDPADSGFVPPTTPTEEIVAALVAELIGKEQIGIDDNFFLLGGHSLLGAQLIVRLQEQFDVELSLLTLFEGPTVRELALEIDFQEAEREAGLSLDRV